MTLLTATCANCEAKLEGVSMDEMQCWRDSHETFCTRPEGRQQAGFTAPMKGKDKQ